MIQLFWKRAGQSETKSATTEGRSMTTTVTATPIDGLTIGASYNEFDGAGLAKTTKSQSQKHTLNMLQDLSH